uniref:Uncharacterized protein n=1 Tax=viral metagenome TaxID=1070528 RepID=A0A6C0CLL0_9ZZZZ
MHILLINEYSKPLKLSENNVTNDPINIIYQFYVDKNRTRHKELQHSLIFNVKNENVQNIYLINEREYSPQELGVNSPKIKQINVGKRLTFKETFDTIETHNIKGYNVIINADIYVDNTIANIRKTDISETKSCIALLRYDVNMRKKTAMLFQYPTTMRLKGLRGDSQDTWIFHSNYNVQSTQRYIFDFPFGKAGCDNKLIYLLKIIGYNLYNTPQSIKTFHLHNSSVRNYNGSDRISPPYYSLFPDCAKIDNTVAPYNFSVNDTLREYLENKIGSDSNFIVPRPQCGPENIVGIHGSDPAFVQCLNSNNKNIIHTLKNNAGIKISNSQSCMKYSQMFLDAFDNSDILCIWEPSLQNQGTIDITNKYKNKTQIWSIVFDIFHFIFSNPWTLALRGKRILIISPFEDTFKQQFPIREHIYGIDLFPDCTFVTIKPPQTQADQPSEEFDIELDRFYKKLDTIKDQYDIALVSAGGYGNLICGHIYKQNKSAIYVGGVLQMYFGVYGERWVRERKDVLDLFMNSHWKRPSSSERPKNHTKVEGSCYW